jgi:hypothetical protein
MAARMLAVDMSSWQLAKSVPEPAVGAFPPLRRHPGMASRMQSDEGTPTKGPRRENELDPDLDLSCAATCGLLSP